MTKPHDMTVEQLENFATNIKLNNLGEREQPMLSMLLELIERYKTPEIPFSGKKIICIDFDGVINSYTSGWKGIDVLPDAPNEGAFIWLKSLIYSKEFLPVIYSSRSKLPMGIEAMKNWFRFHDFEKALLDKLLFPTQKPAAYLTVDDRAFCFNGAFPSFTVMREFTAWKPTEEERFFPQMQVSNLCLVDRAAVCVNTIVPLSHDTDTYTWICEYPESVVSDTFTAEQLLVAFDDNPTWQGLIKVYCQQSRTVSKPTGELPE